MFIKPIPPKLNKRNIGVAIIIISSFSYYIIKTVYLKKQMNCYETIAIGVLLIIGVLISIFNKNDNNSSVSKKV